MADKYSLGGIDIIKIPVMITDCGGIVLYKNQYYSKCVGKPVFGHSALKLLSPAEKEKFESAAAYRTECYISLQNDGVYKKAIVFPYPIKGIDALVWIFVSFFQLDNLNPIADSIFNSPKEVAESLNPFLKLLENCWPVSVKNIEYTLAQKTEYSIACMISSYAGGMPELGCDVKKTIAMLCGFTHDKLAKLGHRIVYDYESLPEGYVCRAMIPTIQALFQLFICATDLSTDRHIAVRFTVEDERLTALIGFSCRAHENVRSGGESLCELSGLIPLDSINLLLIQRIAETRNWRIAYKLGSEGVFVDGKGFGGNTRVGINSTIKLTTEPLSGALTFSAVSADMSGYVEEYLDLMTSLPLGSM